MISTGYVVWPEGQPEKARYAATKLGLWWHRYGPMGQIAGFHGLPICDYWPAIPDEDPVRLAKIMEAAAAVHRRHFGQ